MVWWAPRLTLASSYRCLPDASAACTQLHFTTSIAQVIEHVCSAELRTLRWHPYLWSVLWVLVVVLVPWCSLSAGTLITGEGYASDPPSGGCRRCGQHAPECGCL